MSIRLKDIALTSGAIPIALGLLFLLLMIGILVFKGGEKRASGVEAKESGAETPTSCLSDAKMSWEWEQDVKNRLNYPATYDNGGFFNFSLGPSNAYDLNPDAGQVDYIGYNFIAKNAFGVPVELRAEGSFLRPGCGYIGTTVHEGHY